METTASPLMPATPIAAGYEALARRAWHEARAAFEAALETEITPEALEGLGSAAWWLDDARTLFEARAGAYRLYVERGDARAAARLAITIAEDYMDFRAEPAVANGWRARARRFLEPLGDVPERGWLAVWEGHYALLAGGDPRAAREHALEATRVGRALRDLDLEMIGRALEGLAFVSEGRVAAGMSRLDEATAAALAGEMSDPLAVTVSCCYLVNACERVRDFDRAAQWCERVKELGRRWGVRSVFALCRPHYAAVLMWRGEWEAAEAELLAATREIATIRPGLQGDGTVRLAELRRLQGRFDEARTLLESAEGHPMQPLIGAALALDEGDAELAADRTERFLRGVAADDRTERLLALEIRARALLALGRRREAVAVINDLRSAAATIGTDPVRASASYVEGLLSLERGGLEEARRELEDAVDLFARVGARLDVARARAALARSLARSGRLEAAVREARTALEAFERIGAMHEARLARELLDSFTPGSAPAGEREVHRLTAREVDVLRHVAEGLSNAAIGERLGVSEFTVKRHVANVLTKLGLPSRAAAAAHAAKHGLL